MTIGKQDVRNLPHEFELLESPDLAVSDQIRAALREELNACEASDGHLLQALFDRYCQTQSSRISDILINIRETKEKQLFDRINEGLKTHPMQCLDLLISLVHRQPTWLQRIVYHPVLPSVTKLLRASSNAVITINGLLLLSSLLPFISVLSHHLLMDIMTAFLYGVQCAHNKTAGLDKVVSIHLKIGVYALFHRLYGMYPKNFLGFLRNEFVTVSDPDRHDIYADIIKPMLYNVRLHPALLSGSKEEEHSKERWRRVEPVDIVAECSRLCLDPNEDSWNCQSALFEAPASVSETQAASFELTPAAKFHHFPQPQNQWFYATPTISSAQSNQQIMAAVLLPSMASGPVKENSLFDSSVGRSSEVKPHLTLPNHAYHRQPHTTSIHHDSSGSSMTAPPHRLICIDPSVDSRSIKKYQSDAKPGGEETTLWSPSEAVGLSTPPDSRPRSPVHGNQSDSSELHGRRNSKAQMMISGHQAASKESTCEQQKPEKRGGRRSSVTSKGFTRTLSKLLRKESSADSNGVINTTSPPGNMVSSHESYVSKSLPIENEGAEVQEPSSQYASAVGSPLEIAEEAIEDIDDEYYEKPRGDANSQGTVSLTAPSPELEGFPGAYGGNRSTSDASPRPGDTSDVDDVGMAELNNKSATSDYTVISSEQSGQSINFEAETEEELISGPANNESAPISRKESTIGELPSQMLFPPRFVDRADSDSGGSQSATGWAPPKRRRHGQSLGSASALSPSSLSAAGPVPRLTASSSVTEFMKKVNRYRFDSFHGSGNSMHASANLRSANGEISTSGEHLMSDVMGSTAMDQAQLGGVGVADALTSEDEMLDETAEDELAELDSKQDQFRRRSSSMPSGVRKLYSNLRNLTDRARRTNFTTPAIAHGRAKSSASDYLELGINDAAGKLYIEVTKAKSPCSGIGQPAEMACLSDVSKSPDPSKKVSTATMENLLTREAVQDMVVKAVLNEDRFPYLKFVSACLPTIQTNDKAAPSATPQLLNVTSPYEALQEYMTMGQQIQDVIAAATSDKKETDVKEMTREVQVLRLRARLMNQQMIYERFKRQMHAQRNQRLFSRIKQVSVLEELNDAYAKQIAMLGEERDRLITGLTDERIKFNAEKEKHSQQEHELKMQNNKYMKDLEEIKAANEESNRLLVAMRGELNDLRSDFGKNQQQLSNAEMENKWMQEQILEAVAVRNDQDRAQKKLLVASEVNSQLKEVLSVYKNDLVRKDMLRSNNDALNRELCDLRKAIRKDKSMMDASRIKIAEVETALIKKNNQINELRRNSENARASHKEYVQALGMKYKALVSVCQRQEGHILELYTWLENANTASLLQQQRYHQQQLRRVRSDNLKDQTMDEIPQSSHSTPLKKSSAGQSPKVPHRNASLSAGDPYSTKDIETRPNLYTSTLSGHEESATTGESLATSGPVDRGRGSDPSVFAGAVSAGIMPGSGSLPDLPNRTQEIPMTGSLTLDTCSTFGSQTSDLYLPCLFDRSVLSEATAYTGNYFHNNTHYGFNNNNMSSNMIAYPMAAGGHQDALFRPAHVIPSGSNTAAQGFLNINGNGNTDPSSEIDRGASENPGIPVLHEGALDSAGHLVGNNPFLTETNNTDIAHTLPRYS